MNTETKSTGDLIKDIEAMHEKFEVNDVVWSMLSKNPEILSSYLKFRLDMCQEELTETYEAFEKSDSEELVDGLIDLIVFAVGTLDVLDIDIHKAWTTVMNANLAKTPGVKEGRPNKFGFPDLIKPEGWKAPSHEDNHGILPQIFGASK